MKAYILIKSYLAGKDNNMPGYYIGDVYTSKEKAEEMRLMLIKNHSSINDMWFIVERDLNK